MPLYRVVLSRVEYHGNEVEIEAADEAEAEILALEMMGEEEGDDWVCQNADESVVYVEEIVDRPTEPLP